MNERIAMAHLTVVAKIVAKPESAGIVRSELLKMIAPTRNEDGCIAYRLHQDNSDPAVFIFYETWESAASLEKHMETEHFKAYVKAVESLIVKKVVNRMTLIA